VHRARSRQPGAALRGVTAASKFGGKIIVDLLLQYIVVRSKLNDYQDSVFPFQRVAAPGRLKTGEVDDGASRFEEIRLLAFFCRLPVRHRLL
jgi:hypothetical protein